MVVAVAPVGPRQGGPHAVDQHHRPMDLRTSPGERGVEWQEAEEVGQEDEEVHAVTGLGLSEAVLSLVLIVLCIAILFI